MLVSRGGGGPQNYSLLFTPAVPVKQGAIEGCTLCTHLAHRHQSKTSKPSSVCGGTDAAWPWEESAPCAPRSVRALRSVVSKASRAEARVCSNGCIVASVPLGVPLGVRLAPPPRPARVAARRAHVRGRG